MNFNAENTVLGFPFFLFFFFENSEKEFEKLFSRTAVSYVHAMLAEKRVLFMTAVLQILFRILKNTVKREIHVFGIWIS